VLYLVSSAIAPGAPALARHAVRKGVALVWNQNGVAYPAWHGPGWEPLNAEMASMLRLARHVVYQSEFCKLSADRFVAPPAGSWEVLYNAVDTERFVPARVARRGLTLLVAGTQDVSYRLSVALEVLARVARRRDDARMLVTGRLHWGSGGAEAEMETRRWIEQLGVQNRVEFLGPYPQADAAAIYQRGDVLLHCKYNDPSPGVVVEALAAGLPVVYSASGGVPEMVGSDAGVGVPAELSWDRIIPPDPDAMAEAVLAVADHRERFAQAARQRAVDCFDLKPWLRRHAEIFERVVEGRAP
jgi:glycosyltransferase involved in cell wall biosynthesis